MRVRPEKMARRKEKKSVEKKILTVFARKGESWSYDLWKNEKVATRKAVDAALKRLMKKKLIRISRTEKRGSTKTVYELTMSGLFVALSIEDTWEHTNKVAKTQERKLPLIFRNWNHFIESRAKEDLKEAMKNFFKVALIKLDLSEDDESMIRIYELKTREYLNRHVLFFHLPLFLWPFFDKTSKEKLALAIKRAEARTFKWVRVWFDHPELKKYMMEHFDREEKESETRLIVAKRLKEFIRMLEREKARD